MLMTLGIWAEAGHHNLQPAACLGCYDVGDCEIPTGHRSSVGRQIEHMKNKHIFTFHGVLIAELTIGNSHLWKIIQ